MGRKIETVMRTRPGRQASTQAAGQADNSDIWPLDTAAAQFLVYLYDQDDGNGRQQQQQQE